MPLSHHCVGKKCLDLKFMKDPCIFNIKMTTTRGSPGGLVVKNTPAMPEIQVQPPDQEDATCCRHLSLGTTTVGPSSKPTRHKYWSLSSATRGATAMESLPATAGEKLLLTQLEKSSWSNEDPAQSKINKWKSKRCQPETRWAFLLKDFTRLWKFKDELIYLTFREEKKP